MPNQSMRFTTHGFIEAAEQYLRETVKIWTEKLESPVEIMIRDDEIKDGRWTLASQVYNELSSAGCQSWEDLDKDKTRLSKVSITARIIIAIAKEIESSRRTY